MDPKYQPSLLTPLESELRDLETALMPVPGEGQQLGLAKAVAREVVARFRGDPKLAKEKSNPVRGYADLWQLLEPSKADSPDLSATRAALRDNIIGNAQGIGDYRREIAGLREMQKGDGARAEVANRDVPANLAVHFENLGLSPEVTELAVVFFDLKFDVKAIPIIRKKQRDEIQGAFLKRYGRLPDPKTITAHHKEYRTRVLASWKSINSSET